MNATRTCPDGTTLREQSEQTVRLVFEGLVGRGHGAGPAVTAGRREPPRDLQDQPSSSTAPAGAATSVNGMTAPPCRSALARAHAGVIPST